MKLKIELEEAFALFDQYIKPIQESESLPLEKALGKILAQDIYSPMDQPPFNKSAMDGYAFYYEESENATKENPVHLEVVDSIMAGEVCTKEVKKGQAIQIMTGACVPEYLTCVLPFEKTNDSIEDLEIYASCKNMANICIKGEDFKTGDLLLKKGQKLDYAALGVLASVGYTQVEVVRSLKIALCTTGEELIVPGNPLVPGKIYDSNSILLRTRLNQLGYPVSFYTHIVDDELSCAELFTKLSQEYDLILSTGAVSMGKKDIIHPALKIARAERIFWKLRLKPGSPAVFSILNNTPILSLSGNPFAATCSFELLARYVLSILSQDESLKVEVIQAKLETPFLKRSPQRRFIRAKYKHGAVAIPMGSHSNNEIGSLIGCNALIDVEEGNAGLDKEEFVKVWLL